MRLRGRDQYPDLLRATASVRSALRRARSEHQPLRGRPEGAPRESDATLPPRPPVTFRPPAAPVTIKAEHEQDPTLEPGTFGHSLKYLPGFIVVARKEAGRE
jgi:hypothetical protein